MNYFKNTELAKIYGVSEKSIRNWIQAAREEKLDLQLQVNKDKYYIANTPRNNLLIEDLVKRGKKYKNSRAFKTVSPLPAFYELCDTRQIFDLISSLDVHREIPHQYSYLNGGAQHWDQYATKLSNEKTPNSITNTIQLLDLNKDYITSLIDSHKGFNVIDVGVGNCIPVRQLLTHLLDKEMLMRYIGLDVSKEMLKIADEHINEWFKGNIKLESHIRDINYDRFEDLLIANSFKADNNSAINLVLFFGGTISNFRDPDQALKIINNSMGKNDIFMLTRKLDTEATRRYFDFAASSDDTDDSDIKEKNMLNLLGIDESFYVIERYFDHEKMARVMQATLKVDLEIKFKLEGKDRSVEISKGEGILLWRSDHQTLQETIKQLDVNGFELLQATKSRDQQYSLFISKIKSMH